MSKDNKTQSTSYLATSEEGKLAYLLELGYTIEDTCLPIYQDM